MNEAKTKQINYTKENSEDTSCREMGQPRHKSNKTIQPDPLMGGGWTVRSESNGEKIEYQEATKYLNVT